MIELFVAGCSIGVAVAADVSIVTIAKFKDRTLSTLSWTVPITLLHVAFIALGLYGALDWIKEYPSLQATIYAGAGVLVLWLCLEWFCEWIDQTLSFGPMFIIAILLHKTPITRFAPNLALMIALSIDALLSAPSFSGEATDWPQSGIVMVLTLVGCMVFALVRIAIIAANRLEKHTPENQFWFVTLSVVAKFFQSSVIGYFGIRSLSLGLSYPLNFYESSLTSFLLTSLFFVAYHKQLLAVTRREYQVTI